MPGLHRNAPKPIVPSFEAFKALPVDNLEIAQLLTNCELLEGEQLAAEFKVFFVSIAAKVNSQAHFEKMEEFLKTAGALIPGFKKQLEEINRVYNQNQNINQKNDELKKIFGSPALSNYFAKYWKKEFSNVTEQEALTTDQKIQHLFDKGNQQTLSEYGQAARNAVYRLETQVVRNAIKILFQLIDASFIAAGIIQEPMYEHMYGSAEGDDTMPMPVAPGQPPRRVPRQR